MHRERSFEQPKPVDSQTDVRSAPTAPVFKSSRGEIVPADNVRAVCQGCSLTASDGIQCCTRSAVDQADNARAGKCVWKRP